MTIQFTTGQQTSFPLIWQNIWLGVSLYYQAYITFTVLKMENCEISFKLNIPLSKYLIKQV